MRYAQIDNNTVVAVSDLHSEVSAAHMIPLDAESPVSPGWFYDAAAGAFTAPAEPEPAPEARHISLGAFFDRIGPGRYAILADANPLVQALIRDVSVRKYIDLSRDDLAAGLQMLVDAGHAIDVQTILSSPVLPGERP